MRIYQFHQDEELDELETKTSDALAMHRHNPDMANRLKDELQRLRREQALRGQQRHWERLMKARGR